MQIFFQEGSLSGQYRQPGFRPGGPAPRNWDNNPVQYGKRGRDFDNFGGDFPARGFQNRVVRKAVPPKVRTRPVKKKVVTKDKKKEEVKEEDPKPEEGKR